MTGLACSVVAPEPHCVSVWLFLAKDDHLQFAQFGLVACRETRTRQSAHNLQYRTVAMLTGGGRLTTPSATHKPRS
jgi:hypothetical protein